MFCTNCGAQNNDNAFRCEQCTEVLGRSPEQDLEGYAPAPSRLAWSIVVTLLCCLPFGVPAIVFAAKTMEHNGAQRYDLAYETSKKATMWCWISFGVGIAFTSIYLALSFISVIATTP